MKGGVALPGLPWGTAECPLKIAAAPPSAGVTFGSAASLPQWLPSLAIELTIG
jgi:hypothetical protein